MRTCSLVSGLTVTPSELSNHADRGRHTSTVGMCAWVKGCHSRAYGYSWLSWSSIACILLKRESRKRAQRKHVGTCGPSTQPQATMNAPPAAKRRRTERSPSPVYKLDDEGDYQPYIPVEQRRQDRLAQLTNRRGPESKQERAKREREERDEREDEQREEERKREKARKERTLLMEAQDVHSRKAAEGVCDSLKSLSLLISPTDAKKTDQEKAEEADAEILAAIASRKKLASDMELAKGINYTESIQTTYVAASKASNWLFN
jgi:hypothetical protein